MQGDEFCGDEANNELCKFDRGDCCDLDFDRSLCTECFCYINITEVAKSKLYNSNSMTGLMFYTKYFHRRK